MKFTRIALMIVAAAFAAVSAQAQYSCYAGSLNGKFVVQGGGKKITLSLLGAVTLEQEHNTTGYIVFDGNGNITDGKLEEEIDSSITEHTGVTGTYTVSGTACSGELTIQASGYHRTFNLSVSGMRVDNPGYTPAGLTLLPNGGNGEDEVYTAELTDDPSTVNSIANAPMSKLTPNATGGCTADMLNGLSFDGTVDGGTGGNVRKGTIKLIFNNSGSQSGLINVGVSEILIVDGALQNPLTTNYNGVVNPDCTVELDSGTTKVGELILSHLSSASLLSSSAVTLAAAPLTSLVDSISWDMPNGEWGQGKVQNW